MHRIDSSTAAATLPAPAAAGTPGFFTAGNPAAGVPPTSLTNDFFNTVQEELIGVIAAAALAPDKTNNGQLLAAILRLILGDPSTIGPNGSITLAGGLLIIQWGSLAIGSGSNTFATPLVFPEPFPNAAWGCVGNATARANTLWGPVVVTPESLTKTGCSIQTDTANPAQNIAAGNSVFWIAIGH